MVPEFCVVFLVGQRVYACRNHCWLSIASLICLGSVCLAVADRDIFHGMIPAGRFRRPTAKAAAAAAVSADRTHHQCPCAVRLLTFFANGSIGV